MVDGLLPVLRGSTWGRVGSRRGRTEPPKSSLFAAKSAPTHRVVHGEAASDTPPTHRHCTAPRGGRSGPPCRTGGDASVRTASPVPSPPSAPRSSATRRGWSEEASELRVALERIERGMAEIDAQMRAARPARRPRESRRRRPARRGAPRRAARARDPRGGGARARRRRPRRHCTTASGSSCSTRPGRRQGPAGGLPDAAQPLAGRPQGRRAPGVYELDRKAPAAPPSRARRPPRATPRRSRPARTSAPSAPAARSSRPRSAAPRRRSRSPCAVLAPRAGPRGGRSLSHH